MSREVTPFSAASALQACPCAVPLRQREASPQSKRVPHRFPTLIALSLLLAVTGLAYGSDQISACIANIKQIDGAVQQWGLENKLTASDTYSLSNAQLLAFLPLKELPPCPAGGRYLAGANIGGEPFCSVHGTIEQAATTRQQRRAEARREGQIKILPWDAAAAGIVCGLMWLLSARGGLSERGRRALAVCVPPVSFVLAVTFIWLTDQNAFRSAPTGQPPGILLTFSGGIGLWLANKERGGMRAYGVATCWLLPIGLLLCFVWADAR